MNAHLCSIERLESRIAPAGLVTVLQQGGKIIINGDGADNSIVISTNADPASPSTTTVVEIHSADGQLLRLGSNGAASTSAIFLPLTEGLEISLKGGHDRLSIAGAAVPKDLLIELGAGNNMADLNDVSSGGRISVISGAGGDTLTGSLSQVANSVDIALGNGTNRAWLFSGVVEIGKNLTYSGGSGVDDVEFSTEIARIHGNVTATLGGGANNFHFFSHLVATVGGSISVTNASHADGLSTVSIDLQYSSRASEIEHQLGLNTIAGNVTITNGDGTFHNQLGALSVEIGGAVRMTNGKTTTGTTVNEIIGINRLNIAGSLSVTNGAGATENNIVRLRSGYAPDRIQIGGALAVTGSGGVKIELAEVRGATTLNALSSGLNAQIDESHFANLFTFNGGAGSDALTIETRTITTNLVSTFDRAVSVNLGGGNDSAQIGGGTAATRAVFNSTVKLNGGAGSDLLDYLARGNSFPNGQPVVADFEALI